MTPEILQFVVNHQPVPQPRQRHNKRGQNFIPKSHPIHKYKIAIQESAFLAKIGNRSWPAMGPIKLEVLYVLPRLDYLEDGPRIPHSFPRNSKDIDNLNKAIMDACTGILWIDDSQIFDERSEKWYGATGEPPFAIVSATQILDWQGAHPVKPKSPV